MAEILKMVNRFLPRNLSDGLTELGELLNGAEEIRLRAQKPVSVKIRGKEININSSGACSLEKAICPSSAQIEDIAAAMCEYSPFAYIEEMRRGYITLEGGCRVGIVGTAIIQNGEISQIKYINSLNIRIAREIKGCADSIIDSLDGSIMIISPPGCGKTTLLRDIIRQLSNSGKNISVIDERGELSGSYQGRAQLDLGIRTDILCGCGKSEGLLMLLRAMAPDIIAVDEIGSAEDAAGIREAFNCGVYIACTVHGSNLDEVKRRVAVGELIKEKLFDRYIVLSARSGVGTIENIYNRELIGI